MVKYMIKNRSQGGKRKGVIFGVLAIILLFVSSTTVVPQVQGSTTIKQIDKIYSSPFLILTAMLSKTLKKDSANILTHGSSVIKLDFVKSMLSMFLSLLKKGYTNGGILNFLMALLSIPILIIKILLKAGVAFANSILKIIGAIISIIALIFLGLQTGLTLSALLVILMGIISKIGVKVFTVIGAPIFALIAAQITMLSGNIIGGASMIVHSVIAFALFLAIPIVIAVALYFLISGGEGGGGTTEHNNGWLSDLLYMILSVISYHLKGGE